MPAADRDVWITGIGLVTPAGCDATTTWQNLLAGRRCIHSWPGLASPVGTSPRLAATIADVSTSEVDRISELAWIATQEAIAHAGWSPDELREIPAGRLHMVMGTSKGSLPAFAAMMDRVVDRRRSKVENSGVWAHLMAQAPPDGAARYVAGRLGLFSPVDVPVAACATGTVAVARAASAIAAGDADVVLCGSSDASLHELWFSALEQMGVLAAPHSELGPGYACRPFDRTRTGFALGEGAACLVLEAAGFARRRGAEPLAQVVGWAIGHDPAGLTQVTGDGAPLASVIRQACLRAKCDPCDVKCVHAHGTGTLPNDAAETAALRSVLGPAIRGVPIVSVKGMIGHLLGAAGSVELGVAAMSCRTGMGFGNAAMLEPDPSLGDLWFPREAVRFQPGRVLKTSLGFGGHLAAVVLAP